MRKTGISVFFLLSFVLNLSVAEAAPWHSAPSQKKFDLAGKRALIITTSHRYLDYYDEESNENIPPFSWTQDTLGSAGVYAPEMTEPYYRFLDSGMEVDIASIDGGEIPVTWLSLLPGMRTGSDSRYLADSVIQDKVKHSLKISDVNPSQYDLVFLAGGWGAAYDFPVSEELGQFITQSNAEKKIIGAVCHGPLGLLKAKDAEGAPLLKGKPVTAVTNHQLRLLMVAGTTPYHPETELKNIGADYQCESHWTFVDLFSHRVVQCDNIITGQNQRAGIEVADRMMESLEEK